MSAPMLAGLLIALLTAARLCVAAAWPITDAEAYYWMCGTRMDLAFFDGPAGTAALVRMGEMLAGPSSGVFGLRLMFPILAAAASAAAYALAGRLYGDRAALWSAVMLNVLPGFNLAAVQAGPDTPALCALLAAAYFAYRAMSSSAIGWFALAGFALGIGALFRYAVALSALSVVACLAVAPHGRRIAAPVAVACLVALAGVTPGIAWNSANEWAPLGLGTWRTVVRIDWAALPEGVLLAGASLGLGGAVVAASGLADLVRESRLHVRPRFLAAWSAPPLVLWLYHLCHGTASPLDAVAGGTMLIIPAAHVLGGRRRSVLVWCAAVAAVSTAVAAVLPDRAVRLLARREFGGEWRQIAAEVSRIESENALNFEKPLFVIAKDARATSLLHYFLAHSGRGSLAVFVRESQDLSDQFGLWPRYDAFLATEKPTDDLFTEVQGYNPYVGRSALYVTDELEGDLPQTIRGAFASVAPAGELRIERGGARNTLRLYLCRDYETMPL